MTKRRNLRYRTKKPINCRGLLPLAYYLTKIPVGTAVTIRPSADRTDYYPPATMHGHHGLVKKKFKSNLYEVYVPDLRKTYIGSKSHLIIHE